MAPTLFSIFLSAMLEEAFKDMLFADDSALIVHSAEEIQRIVDAYVNASSKFGLKINIKKDRSDVPTELYNGHGGGH